MHLYHGGVRPVNSTIKGISYEGNSSGGLLRLTSWGPKQCTYPQIDLNTWYHAVGTYSKDDGLSKLYVNGILVDMRNDIDWSIHTYNNSFGIGNIFWDTWANSGNQIYISNARVYNRALEEDEISYIYDNYK